MTLFAVVEHTTKGYCDSCTSCQASFLGVFSTREKALDIAEQNNMGEMAVVEVVLDELNRDSSIY